MESRVKLLGHPVHPMLTVLRLGLLSASVVFDVVHLLTNEPASGADLRAAERPAGRP